MEQKTLTAKKISLFTVAAVLINALVGVATSFISNKIPASEIGFENYSTMNTLNYAISLASGIIFLAAILILGFVLTKNKTKTLIFAGSVFFGRNLVAIFISLITTLLKAFSITETVAISTALDIIAIPFIAFVAYFAFTAFEGLNPKFTDRSINSSELTLSVARKRYIIADIITLIVSALLTSIPSAIIGFFPEFVSETWFTVVYNLLTWFTNALTFIILYLAGYKAHSSHIDGMAMRACIGLSSIINTCILRFLLTAQYVIIGAIFPTGIEENVNTYMTATSSAMSVIPFISTIISFITVLYFLRFFFVKAKITLFTETPEIPIESEEAEEISLDAE